MFEERKILVPGDFNITLAGYWFPAKLYYSVLRHFLALRNLALIICQ